MGVAQQFDEWTPKSKGRTAPSKKKQWGWHNNLMNGRQKARAELPLPKKTVRLKSKGRSARLQKKLGQGQTKRADLPGGRIRDFPYLLVGQMLGSL
jgi:hypothetical protein